MRSESAVSGFVSTRSSCARAGMTIATNRSLAALRTCSASPPWFLQTLVPRRACWPHGPPALLCAVQRRWTCPHFSHGGRVAQAVPPPFCTLGFDADRFTRALDPLLGSRLGTDSSAALGFVWASSVSPAPSDVLRVQRSGSGVGRFRPTVPLAGMGIRVSGPPGPEVPAQYPSLT